MSKASALFRLSLVVGIFLSFTFVYANYASSKSETREQLDQGISSSQLLVDPTPTPTPHTLVGSYYVVDENIEAKLLLNNKGNAPLEVQPTLYNKQGQELQLPSVTVDPQNFRFINLADWAGIGGESFKSGNIKLFHYGKDLVLGAQIYLTDETRSLSFEEKLAEKGKFDSRRQEAVWWMPSSQAKVKIVLTNTSGAPIAVTCRLAKKTNTVSSPQTILLDAHQTKVFDLRDDFPNSSQFLNAEILALSLDHSGATDALLARILVAETQRGYSNVVQFSNPSRGKSSEFEGVGFQIEDVEGIRLTPVVVVRNVGPSTSNVTARVPFTRMDGTRGTISLPQKQLSAGEIGFINTLSIVTRVQQEQIKVASLEMEYNTAPGSIVIAAHSVSEDRNQVFRVPMWDPLGQRSPTGGYPWRIEGTSVTQTYIKNIADYEEDYVSFLVWENGGMYMLGLKPIAAHETVHIDVKKLRDEQIPDEQGRTIPLSVSSGQLQWTLRRKDSQSDGDILANLALIGRSEQVDITKGVSNNYSCQNCCPGTHISGFIAPSSVVIEYGETAYFGSVEVQESCYNFPYQFNVGASWNTSNTGLGTISGGYITGQGIGHSNIGASWTTYFGIVYPCTPGGENPPLLFLDSASYQSESTSRCQSNEKTRGGPSVSENEESLANTVMFLPGCGTCQLVSFVFIPPSASLTVKPRVQKIQYQEPGTSNYIDIMGTLYVSKDTTVNFRAVPFPNNGTFPDGQPTWSGTSGVSGTGPTKSVTFNTKSNNSTDYKTVVAQVDTPVIVNIVVYELIGALNPVDSFVGRSVDRYGINEDVSLGFLISPSLTAQQAGGLTWKIVSGGGSVNNTTTGSDTYTAPRTSGALTLKLEIQDGPSKSRGPSYDKAIVAPSGAYMIKSPEFPDLWHCNGTSSVGFFGEVRLNPRDVSFNKLFFREGGGTFVATGFYSSSNGAPHMPTLFWTPVNDCNYVSGCKAFLDQVYTGQWPPEPRRGYYFGTGEWPIAWNYGFVPDLNPVISGETNFLTAVHYQESNSVGTASIQKAGAGPFLQLASEPDNNCQ